MRLLFITLFLMLFGCGRNDESNSYSGANQGVLHESSEYKVMGRLVEERDEYGELIRCKDLGWREPYNNEFKYILRRIISDKLICNVCGTQDQFSDSITCQTVSNQTVEYGGKLYKCADKESYLVCVKTINK